MILNSNNSIYLLIIGGTIEKQEIMTTPYSFICLFRECCFYANRAQKISIALMVMFCCLALDVNAQTHIVNTTDDIDDGKCNANHCSLREAIHDANLLTGSIEFNIPGQGPFEIAPNIELPKVYNNNITIDATTQPNWSAGMITLNGKALSNGLYINGSQIGIYGLKIIKCTNAAIVLDTINNEQKDVAIGMAGKSNILMNNKFGILSTTDLTFDVTIQSNYIGTDNFFAQNGGNQHAIVFTGSQVFNVKIGGSTNMGDGNVIMDSADEAVVISHGTEVYGNVIGGAWPNQKSGIFITGSSNKIGGGTLELQNVISNNVEYAVRLDNSSASGNTLSYNSFYCNGFGDFLNNGNNGINPPIIEQNSNGKLIGSAVPNSSVEIYTHDFLCQDCQAETFKDVTTADGFGDWTYDFGYPITASITASSTDNNGNTSAFSNCFSSDDCVDAFLVPLVQETCPIGFTVFNTEFASTSPEPFNNCSGVSPNIPPVDIWLKAEVPASGAVMLQLDTNNTVIHPYVEVYTGDCGFLQFEKCDSLTVYPYQFPVAEMTPGEFVYFRIFDTYNLNQGYVSLNVIKLPSDTAEWELCTDGVEFRAANDFIVQYDEGATPADVQLVTDDLLAEGLDLVGDCGCGARPLQLWRGSTPVEAETGGIIAKDKPDVDTVDYNFIIEDQLCVTENILTTIVYFPGSQGQSGGSQVVIEPVFSYDDCTPEGLIEPLGPLYSSSVSEPNVSVAIIDTGFDEDNDFIENAVWQNPELLDTDNCYLNDNSGYDFINDVGNPTDIAGHGTGVAGIVAGGFNQSVDLNMLNLKFSESERSTLFPAICAMYYAIDNGAQVMNLSWGFLTSEPIPNILKDVIDYASEKDVLIVTSAGNRGIQIDAINKFPANYDKPNIITVGAFQQFAGSNPVIAPYSNFGISNVDLLANGQVETVGLSNTIEVLSGTSLAAPLVSKTAAEIRAKYPALSAQDVRDCILNSVDVYSNLNIYCSTSGVLNRDEALQCAYDKSLEFCGELIVFYGGSHPIDTLIVKEISIVSTGSVSSYRDVVYKAGDNVLLDSDFSVELGSTFLATIEDCAASVPLP